MVDAGYAGDPLFEIRRASPLLKAEHEVWLEQEHGLRRHRQCVQKEGRSRAMCGYNGYVIARMPGLASMHSEQEWRNSRQQETSHETDDVSGLLFTKKKSRATTSHIGQS